MNKMSGKSAGQWTYTERALRFNMKTCEGGTLTGSAGMSGVASQEFENSE